MHLRRRTPRTADSAATSRQRTVRIIVARRAPPGAPFARTPGDRRQAAGDRWKAGLETHLLIAQRLRYLDGATTTILLAQTAEVGRILGGLMRRMREPGDRRQIRRSMPFAPPLPHDMDMFE